jgi:hypothetical protein
LPDSLQHEVPVLGTSDQQQGLFCNLAPTNLSGDLPGNLIPKLHTFLWRFPLPKLDRIFVGSVIEGG